MLKNKRENCGAESPKEGVLNLTHWPISYLQPWTANVKIAN